MKTGSARLVLLSSFCLASLLLAAARAQEEAAWKSTLALGANFTDGNTESSLYNADLSAERTGDPNEFRTGAMFAYGEKDDDKTEERAKAFAQYNRLVSERTFGYVNGEAAYDDIANVDYRLIVGPGMGRYFLKSDARTLSAEAGASYIREQIKDVITNADGTTASDTATDDRFVLRVAERYETSLGDASRLWQSAEYLPEFEDFGNYLLNTEIGIDVPINSKFDLRVSALDQYNSEPPEGSEKNDITVKAALVWRISGH
jgi:putative salt-induced outer membrane protein YdiY